MTLLSNARARVRRSVRRASAARPRRHEVLQGPGELDGGGGARYFTAFSHLPERRNRNVQAPPAPQGRLQEAQGATRPTQAVNPRAVIPHSGRRAGAPRPVAAAPARWRLGACPWQPVPEGPTMAALFGDRLLEAIRQKGSPICVGIDPIFEMLPDDVAGDAGDRDANDYEAVIDAIFAF